MGFPLLTVVVAATSCEARGARWQPVELNARLKVDPLTRPVSLADLDIGGELIERDRILQSMCRLRNITCELRYLLKRRP